jgi:type IV pilus assembly protein PilN
MPRINLLPWREVERARLRQEFMLAMVAAVLIGVLGVLVIRWQYGVMISQQKARNQYLTDQIKQLDGQISEITDLEQQQKTLGSRIKVIEQLQQSRPEAVHIFDQLVRLLPEGVYLTEVTQTDRRIQIKGISESSSRVSTFMRNIDSSEWLENPSLEIIEAKGTAETGSSFTLYANQIALSTDSNAADKGNKNKEKS